MHNLLKEIIVKKCLDLIKDKKNISETVLKKRVISLKQKRSFVKHLMKSNKNGFAIIAEIKLASPTNPFLGSKGEIINRVIEYKKAKADAISYITEKHYFKGDISFIRKIKKATSLPILQKDFVIDHYQIYQAKNIGSDALLLIAKLIDRKTLKNFIGICKEIGVEPVVEINNQEDLEKTITTTTSIIAVNARDLTTFKVDVDKACNLIRKIPDRFIKLGFSGIKSNIEVKKYKLAGAKGVLVGTSLMKAKNIEKFIKGLRI